MSRRKVSLGLLLAALTLIGLALVPNLFTRANAWERLSDATRTSYDARTLDQLAQAASGLQRSGPSIQAALPQLQSRLGMTDAEFQAFIGQFPLTSAAVQTFPAFGNALQSTATTLKAQIANFRQADAIPTNSAPSVAVPWFMVICGALVMTVAILPIRRRALIGSALALVIGAAVIAMPLATHLPRKSAAADRLNHAVRPLFTTTSVQRTTQGQTAVSDTITELSTKFAPAVTQRLPGVNLSDLFPTLTQQLSVVPTLSASVAQLNDNVSRDIPDFNRVAGTRYEWIAWSTVALGGLIVFGAVWGLVGALQTRRDAEIHVLREWRAKHPHHIRVAS